MQNTLFYYKIGVRVVESGDKWFKVVDFRPGKMKCITTDRGRPLKC